MTTIHKYPVKAVIEMPADAKIIKLDIQGPQAMFWAEVDTDNALEQRFFGVFGTGWDLPEYPDAKLKHIDSYQQEGFVWHVYERIYE